MTTKLAFGLPTVAAVADGVADDRAALLAADNADGIVLNNPGTYRVASNLTLTGLLALTPGAKLKPDAGVNVHLSGGYKPWSDYQHCFDLSAGGTVTCGRMAQPYVTPPHF